MKYLIFRTDRTGDFLITSSLIKSIKKNFPSSLIYVVGSSKNINYINESKLVDKSFLLKSNNLVNKIKLIFKLRKYYFNTIIIADKKRRSIFISIFLKSKLKIFNVSSIVHKKILNIFYKAVFLDNDSQEERPVMNVMQDNCNKMGFILKKEDFHYFFNDQFKKYYAHSKVIDLEKTRYLLFHYDEKWELENYTKLYKRANKLTDISFDYKTFIIFLKELSKKTTNDIIISTGSTNTNFINQLIKRSNKIDESIYLLNTEFKAFLIINQNFLSMSHIISKCELFIACHGAFTHVAANYKIKILDIIEKNKLSHYNRVTYYMDNYKYIYRNNFEFLSSDLILNS